MSGTPRADDRPLSPHLQVWRPHLTMAASITHRITGTALYFGSFLIAAWIVSLAIDQDAYGFIDGIARTVPGLVILYLWTVAVLFHFANGIRHLLWDGPNIGFDPKAASAWSFFNYAFAFLGAGGIFAATVWL